MDAAEAWLREHDPAYSASRKAWQVLDDSLRDPCPPPWREIPFGDSAGLASLVDIGYGRYVEEAEQRLCASCGEPFIPTRVGHRFCSDPCRDTARGSRSRAAYMREYRRRNQDA